MTSKPRKFDLAVVLRPLFSAFAWFALSAITGIGLLVAGVYVLIGLGWSLVAAGVLSMATAGMILKGLTRG